MAERGLVQLGGMRRGCARLAHRRLKIRRHTLLSRQARRTKRSLRRRYARRFPSLPAAGCSLSRGPEKPTAREPRTGFAGEVRQTSPAVVPPTLIGKDAGLLLQYGGAPPGHATRVPLTEEEKARFMASVKAANKSKKRR